MFTRLPFGITASPFLLAITIILYMEMAPEAINDKIAQNLYVDNVQKSKPPHMIRLDSYPQ
uniref:Uncharacterized protein n=1 Tax=Caenorhabditis japonica TaxID=281687 RepID=A0A8R1ER95_CAEJA